ncbi:hypothetical protein BSF38_00329 [Paludisphaera borealis]|uniref:DUF4062 domain-containing protein n=1 Tax=Paludisphaera borealis TaxID=1387353 RepID=A0A1U7CJ34_9BACT|nr:hypothetical protein BSF38_00329 [Paludisphaera borealis]
MNEAHALLTGVQRRRVIRLFVSSTFRDFQAERELLAKNVFSQLRALCESRGIACCEVDLRWGITAEEARRDEVLTICLQEVQECQPYFIAMLGERYGWVPKVFPAALLVEHPWLAGLEGLSVTELEIILATLKTARDASLAPPKWGSWSCRISRRWSTASFPRPRLPTRCGASQTPTIRSRPPRRMSSSGVSTRWTTSTLTPTGSGRRSW